MWGTTKRRMRETGLSALKVLIIGDSIAGAYTPLVRERLAGREIVVEQVYAGDSAAILTGLGE